LTKNKGESLLTAEGDYGGTQKNSGIILPDYWGKGGESEGDWKKGGDYTEKKKKKLGGRKKGSA